ncbi:MAG: hypothetical protein FK731_13575 [Asgard group archaeon]|nr:hypothetical protein [Asgard group archaeon]
MRNENSIIDTSTISKEIDPKYPKNDFKTKIKKSISFLKPTILNVIITLTVFIIILAILRNFSISLIASICVYFIIAFVIQPLFHDKLGNSQKVISLKRNNSFPEIITSNNKTILLYVKNKTLIAIALLRVEWLANFINLNQIWNFLQREGIQIQDCREGCFLIIRKKTAVKSNNNLNEEAKKLVKSIERTIQLTKKKFEIEYENISLRLVKEQDMIQTILFLGLASDKFISPSEIISEDFSFLKDDTLQIQNKNMEEQISE